jgi:hypothetical protein
MGVGIFLGAVEWWCECVKKYMLLVELYHHFRASFGGGGAYLLDFLFGLFALVSPVISSVEDGPLPTGKDITAHSYKDGVAIGGRSCTCFHPNVNRRLF